MATFTALYDACVLYPAPLRDLLMRVAMTDLFRARWTDEIHEEWITAVLRDRDDLTRDQLERTRSLMNAHVRDCIVTGYDGLIGSRDKRVLPLRGGHITAVIGPKAPATLQAALLTECGRLLERTAVWMLAQHGTSIDPSAARERYGEGVREVTENLEQVLPEAERKLFRDQAFLFTSQGAPADVAADIAKFLWLQPACDIVLIGDEHERPVREVAEIYYAVGERFGLDWLRRQAGHLPRDTAWEKLAVSAVLDDVYGVQADLCSQVIGAGQREAGAGVRLELWARHRRLSINRTDELLAELRTVGNPDLAMLAVAIRQLKNLGTAPA